MEVVSRQGKNAAVIVLAVAIPRATLDEGLSAKTSHQLQHSMPSRSPDRMKNPNETARAH